MSYLHEMGLVKGDFIEAEVGLFGRDGFRTTGLYNLCVQPAWSSRGDWEFYAGLGFSLGCGSIIDNSSPDSVTGLPFFALAAAVSFA